jgi:hypothetical protein
VIANPYDAAELALWMVEDLRCEVPLFLTELHRRDLPATVTEPVAAMARELDAAAAAYRSLARRVPTPPDADYEPAPDKPTSAALQDAVRQLRGVVDRNRQLRQEFSGWAGTEALDTAGDHLTRALSYLSEAVAGVPDDTLCVVFTLAAAVDTAGMGPIATVEANRTGVRIAIPERYPLKAQVLRRWANRMSDVTVVLHRHRINSIEVRLEVHGTLAGVPVVVHTTYDRKDEPAQVEAITAALESTRPLDVLDTLGEREMRAESGHLVGGRA